MKNRALQIISALVLVLILSNSVFAQHELVTNGEFTNGNTGFSTQYTYKPTGDVGNGEYCVDNNCQGHNNLGLGWPSVPGISGKYMIVNGKGGSSAPSKVVWKQTVNVTSQTTYDFSCQLVNLSRSIFGLNASPSIIRIKIKGSAAGSDVTLNVANHNWQQTSRVWSSGNYYGPVDIEIFDVYQDDPDHGDDFGLDQISFVPRVWYDVNAQDDYVTGVLCLNDSIDVDVLNNDNVLPNTNDAQVQVLTDPIPHGTVRLLPNKKIRYIFTDANYHGEVQFNYRVTNHGVSSEASIHINTALPPTIDDINITSPITVCVGESLTLPTPTVNANGSSISVQRWQVKNNGSWQNVSGNTIPSIANGYSSIRYMVENQCDVVYSEEIQLVVNDKPTIESISGISQDPLCAPATFSYDAPSIENNGSNLVAQGWQMQIGGQWVNVPNTIEYEHNGCLVRYYAENDCGTSYSASVPLTVNAAPIVGSITSPAGICTGDSFDLASHTPQPIWRHNDLSTCWGSWEIQIDGVWDSLVNNNIPYDYNGCLIRYKAVNGCGIAYSTNNVQITVYSTEPYYEGLITACDAIYHHGQYCDTTGLYVSNDSITPNGCQIQVSWHFSLGEVNIMPAEVYERCHSYYWPRTGQTYYESTVVSDTVYSTDPQVCDSVFTLDLTINNAPTLQGGIQAHDICAGELLGVDAPEYEYNHSGGGRAQWYVSSLDGSFQPFDPETHHFEFGSYYIVFAVINGCDSVSSNVELVHVNDQPVISGQLSSMQVCEGNPLDLPEVTVDWHNASQSGFSEWQMAENQVGPYAHFDSATPMQTVHNGHWVRFMAFNECDTVYLGPVRVTVIDEQDVTIEHEPECDSVLFAGVYYSESTIVDEMIDEPCPHTIHHHIVVKHSDRPENNPTLIEEVTSCRDEFEWHGDIYYRIDGPRIVRWTTENASGCDSIRELRLNFGDFATKTDYFMGCDAFTWTRNNLTYYYDESHPQVLDSVSIPGNEVACDSVIYLNLLLGRSYEVVGEPMTECRGFEWHGVPYYENAIVYDSLQTKTTHCDSIVSYQLTIVQPFDTVVEMVSCKPVVWHGHPFVEDEIFTDTLTSTVTGCDSIVTVNFRLDDIVNRFDTVACEPFKWYGYECDYSSTGTMIQHVFETAAGCDSTVIKYVYIYPPEEHVDSVYACDSYLCPFNGIHYDNPGVYFIEKDTAFNQHGCDSIVYSVRLEIKDSEQIGLITGPSNVFVASSLVSGIYRYEIDLEDAQEGITWSLSNPNWQIVEAQQNYCLVFVTTPGTATLSVSFLTSDCGEMERSFEINGGFFGVDDNAMVVANVYPNPTQGSVTIEAEGIESVRLTDMIGQVLDWREYDRSNTVTMNLNGFAPSVYLVEIKTVNGLVKKRLVVSR